jgi:hypothetical protein
VAELAVPAPLTPGSAPDALLLVTPDGQAAAEALRDQMQGLYLGQFKVDPKQMEELNRQMEQFQKDWQPKGLEVAPD